MPSEYYLHSQLQARTPMCIYYGCSMQLLNRNVGWNLQIMKRCGWASDGQLFRPHAKLRMLQPSL